MLRLPEEPEHQLWLEIETIEESKKMQYVPPSQDFTNAKFNKTHPALRGSKLELVAPEFPTWRLGTSAN